MARTKKCLKVTREEQRLKHRKISKNSHQISKINLEEEGTGMRCYKNIEWIEPLIQNTLLHRIVTQS